MLRIAYNMSCVFIKNLISLKYGFSLTLLYTQWIYFLFRLISIFLIINTKCKIIKFTILIFFGIFYYHIYSTIFYTIVRINKP